MWTLFWAKLRYLGERAYSQIPANFFPEPER